MLELFPTIFRAELTAVIEARRVACPPLVVHTDNQQVVDGWEAGKAWSCASNRDGADLWRSFWSRMHDIGPGIQIVKIKAHVPFSRVQERQMSWQDWCGNGLADRWAKVGFATAIKDPPVTIA